MPLLRMCACGATYASAHSDQCLKCIVAGVKRAAKVGSSQNAKVPQEDGHGSNTDATAAKTTKQTRKKAKEPPPPLPSKSMGVTRMPPGTVCALCGRFIPKGRLLEHKQDAHREKMITPSPPQPHKDTWVSVLQGGLPSLGKRSR